MKLTAGILATGSELLTGEIQECHTVTLALALRDLGIGIGEARLVPDDAAAVAAALRELADSYPLVLVTGGLGPTDDDLTARAAADAFERPLVRQAEAERLVDAFFRGRGRPTPPENAKQADLPDIALPLPNPSGSAPGFHLPLAGSDLFFLPGVPTEMVQMLREQVLPRLRRQLPQRPPLTQRIVRVLGLAEAEIGRRLSTLRLPPGVGLGYGLDFPCVLVKFSVQTEDPETLLDPLTAGLRERLDQALAILVDETLPAAVARSLSAAGATLALAESCTGGLVAKLLTDIPGASAFLERAAVTYADSAKQHWLGVPPELLAREGAVSEACARAMAEGVRRAAGSDLGLSLTGIAGPDGGTPEKPVGTVWMGLATPAGTITRRWQLHGDRGQVRAGAAARALATLLRLLDGGDAGER